jgi:hypothetical protein
MDATTLGEFLSGYMKDIRKEWDRLRFLQKNIDGTIYSTWMPRGADAEYKDMLRKAATPWLMYAQNAKAQGLVVDGFTSDEIWREAWQANGMDGRQVVVNREVIGLGKSYGLSLPANGGKVLMRPLSAHSTYAKFADPWDEYPEWVLYRSAKMGKSYWDSTWYFFDATHWYKFTGSPGTPQGIETYEHGLGYCPVVQLSNTLTSDSVPESSIEPGIKPWKRVVDYTFTLSMDMRYGAFPQKWMAGGEIQTDENGNAMIRPAVDSLMHASGPAGETARFGSFQSASISDVVAGLESAKQDLSSILQIPPHYFLGKVINMSAEGIEAAESAYYRDLAERKEALSEGYELWLRTAADILGYSNVADDPNVEIHWMEQRTRSLGQIADAIVKLKTVGAPDELLFALMPGWTKQDVLEAARVANEKVQTGASAPDDMSIETQANALGTLVRAGVDPKDAALRLGLNNIQFTGAVPVSLRMPESEAASLEDK